MTEMQNEGCRQQLVAAYCVQKWIEIPAGLEQDCNLSSETVENSGSIHG